MVVITVRLFGAARAAAGASEVVTSVATLDALVRELSADHGPELERVLARCSFLVDGVAVRDRTSSVSLADASTVDVLPPFAGG